MCDDWINNYYYYNEQVYMGHKVSKLTGLLPQIIKFRVQDETRTSVFYNIRYF